MTESDRLRDGSVLVAAAERTLGRLRTAAATARVGRLLPRSIRPRSDATDDTDADADDDESRRTDAIRRIARQSTIGTALERSRTRVESAFRAAASNSRLTGGGEAIGRYVRGSFCYRWLTAEPDPDVIVIDLRETATVGPPLRAVQRGLEALAPSVATARLTTAGRTAASVLRTYPIRVASLGLFGAVAAGVAALAANGDPGPIPVAVLLALGLLAALGVRSRASWDDIRESRAVGLLAAAFEPPEPPVPPDSSIARSDTDDGDERPTPDSSSDDLDGGG